MSGPKVTVIGAGSYFFGRQVIFKMATSPLMAGGELALVDIDRDVSETMLELAKRAFEKTGCKVKLSGDIDRRKVMADSDFIVLTFSKDNMRYRGIETEVAKKHGITLCSADTIGPAGIFRALREIPEALAIAEDAARLAPEAWLINYVNPTATIGIALQRYAGKEKSFSLCDGQREPFTTINWLKMTGVLPPDAEAIPPEVESRLDLKIAGVNHCTWMLKFEYDGKDMLPVLRNVMESLKPLEAENPSDNSKARLNTHYACELYDVFGAYPTLVSHTKEYVLFFQGHGVAKIEPEPIRSFDAAHRQAEMDAYWSVTEKYARGELSIEQFLKETNSEMAVDIIESMWGDLGNRYYINVPNSGAVTNLSDDAFLELRCDVDMQGPRPLALGPMPAGLLSLQQRILDTHELTAAAAVSGDRALLRRAMMTDPLCVNVQDGDAIIHELLEKEKPALPSYWFDLK